MFASSNAMIDAQDVDLEDYMLRVVLDANMAELFHECGSKTVALAASLKLEQSCGICSPPAGESTCFESLSMSVEVMCISIPPADCQQRSRAFVSRPTVTPSLEPVSRASW